MYKDLSVLLGVSGGVAAYKACVLARLLVKRGASVRVVMTPEATKFVGAETFRALTGHPTHVDMFADPSPDGMGHIHLTRERDLFIVAPATMNTLAKAACGICDNMLLTAMAASDCPIVVCPAMNGKMWDSPANRRNVATLKADGVTVLEPASGSLACGEVGQGRMLEPEDIADLALDALYPKPFAGKRVMLTMGGTYEPIDPVRGITNISSGKMGAELARSFRRLGAEVTAVAGQIKTEIPMGVRAIFAGTALDMQRAVLSNIEGQDCFVAVAAVADYRAAKRSDFKLKKETGNGGLTLKLIENPDILSSVSSLDNPPFCVGFAAESENLEQYAKAKMARKKVKILVANLVSQAMGKDDTQFCIFDPKLTAYPTMPKDKAADEIARAVARGMGLLG